MFAKLYNEFGRKQEWLGIARSGYRIMNEHCFDENGHMYFRINRDGRSLVNQRYYFSEEFAIMGYALYPASQSRVIVGGFVYPRQTFRVRRKPLSCNLHSIMCFLRHSVLFGFYASSACRDVSPLPILRFSHHPAFRLPSGPHLLSSQRPCCKV